MFLCVEDMCLCVCDSVLDESLLKRVKVMLLKYAKSLNLFVSKYIINNIVCVEDLCQLNIYFLAKIATRIPAVAAAAPIIAMPMNPSDRTFSSI